MHLDDRTYRKLLDGRLSRAEARTLAAHLERDCDACERFLAERPADLLDGRADGALAALTPAPIPAGNDLEYARIRRLARAPARRRRGPLVAAAAAALLVAAGGAALLSRPPPSPSPDGVKGLAVRAVPVRLRFVVVDPRGALAKGVAGETVPPTARLAFEVEVGRAADVALVRAGPGAAPEVFYRARLAAGRAQVAAEGRPAAYPLDGLEGTQRFAVVASEEGLAPERLAAAARALAPPARIAADAPALDGLSLDVVEVTVR